MTAGISNELFWTLTPREVEEILKRRGEEERSRNLRAGLVAATIINVHKKKGAPLTKPADFLRSRPQPGDYMDLKQSVRALDAWAAASNQVTDAQTRRSRRRKEPETP